MRNAEAVYAGSRPKQTTSFPSERSAGRPPRAAEDQRETGLPLMSGTTAGKIVPSEVASSPRPFSSGSVDSSQPLPLYKQTLSSALTFSGSGSVSTNNTDNGIAVVSATHAALRGKGHAEQQGEGAELAKGGISGAQKGKGGQEGDGISSSVVRNISAESPRREQRPVVSRATQKEGLLGKRRERAVAPVAEQPLNTCNKATRSDARDKEEEIRRERDLGKSQGESGRGGGGGGVRWTSLFRGSREGILERGERQGERSLLIDNNRTGYTAPHVGRGQTARGTSGIRGAGGEADIVTGANSRDRATSSSRGLRNPATVLSSEEEQGRCIQNLKTKTLKAKHWLLGSLITYFVLGILVLYCISYANVEWCCIFIVFGGVVAGLGLSGLKQVNRTMLLMHAVAAAILLFILFIAWFYNVYVLLRAVEILLASSWAPSERHQFLYYYSIPTAFTSPPAPWIEDVLRMRLSYPSEDNVGIELLIGKQPRFTSKRRHALRPRRSSSSVLQRQKSSRDEESALPSASTTKEESTAAREGPIGDSGKDMEFSAGGPDAAPEAKAGKEKEQAARVPTSAEVSQEPGKQMSRNLGEEPETTSAATNERNKIEGRNRKNIYLSSVQESDKAPGDAVRWQLAAELRSETRGRLDGPAETPEKGSEGKQRDAREEVLSLLDGRRRVQRNRREKVQLATEKDGEKEGQTLPDFRERQSLPMERQIAGEKTGEGQVEVTPANLQLETAVEKKQKSPAYRSRMTRDWQKIWQEERSAGGLRRRLGGSTLADGGAATRLPEASEATGVPRKSAATAAKTTPAGLLAPADIPVRTKPPATAKKPAATTSAAARSPAAVRSSAVVAGTPAGAGAVQTPREQSKKNEASKKRHPYPHIDSEKKLVSPWKAMPKGPEEPIRRIPPESTSANSVNAVAGAKDASVTAIKPAAADMPLATVAKKNDVPEGDNGEDGPLAGQLRGSGEVLSQKSDMKLEQRSSDSADESASEISSLPYSPLDSYVDRPARAAPPLSRTLARAQRSHGQGRLEEQPKSSSMDRDRAARRLIKGCVDGAAKDSAFADKTANTMSSLATKGWLCAFARADVLPFRRWPVDCNEECGYASLHARHVLQMTSFYDVTRIAEYLIQIASLPPKRMQQCIDYAAATVCSIQNRNFIVVWIVLLMLWLLFAIAACCGILPFSLYTTVQVIKHMQPQASAR